MVILQAFSYVNYIAAYLMHDFVYLLTHLLVGSFMNLLRILNKRQFWFNVQREKNLIYQTVWTWLKIQFIKLNFPTWFFKNLVQIKFSSYTEKFTIQWEFWLNKEMAFTFWTFQTKSNLSKVGQKIDWNMYWNLWCWNWNLNFIMVIQQIHKPIASSLL